MINFFITSLICVTKLVGFEAGMNQDDVNAFKRAKYTCKNEYPKQPCLVEFRKKEELVYHAICGVNNGK